MSLTVDDQDLQAQLLATFKEDRALAHRVLFAHRHPDPDPPFHDDLINDWQSDETAILQMVFRGGAKSTLCEEGLLMGACFREFRYCLLIGATEPKACQRLHAIKYEAETNRELNRLFGNLQGAEWSANRAVFANGVTIHALGKGQSLRGLKELSFRPDYCVFDDLEDREDVRTEKAMQETYRWLMFDLIPALAKPHRIRGMATPMHPDAIPMRLEKDGDWLIRKVPVYYRDEQGRKVSAWPERFPMTRDDALAQGKKAKDSIEAMEDSAARNGATRDFLCEYMVTAEAPAEKPFKRDMIRIVPQVRSYQPVCVMFDPARTTNLKSARTGFAAWSWLPSKLIVWESWGRFLSPAEIIGAIFEANERYNPMLLGVEEDGLNEWLLQPIREQARERGVLLPLMPMRAPRAKMDFIRALQPYYAAREVEHNGAQQDLEAELLSFPHGSRVDVPNALAYAPLMRKGRPIYMDFTEKHVQEGITPSRDHPVWLGLNAGRAITTGVLVQVFDRAVRVFADWAMEGDPTEQGPRVVEAARMFCPSSEMIIVGPPLHFDRYNNVGLRQAIRPFEMEKGTDPAQRDEGRAAIRDLLQREMRGLPALLVSDRAKWTTRAFCGGYRHVQLKHGDLADYAEEGVYRVLMEGLESLIGVTKRGRSTPLDESAMNAVTPGGVPYKSMLGAGSGRVLTRR